MLLKLIQLLSISKVVLRMLLNASMLNANTHSKHTYDIFASMLSISKNFIMENQEAIRTHLRC